MMMILNMLSCKVGDNSLGARRRRIIGYIGFIEACDTLLKYTYFITNFKKKLQKLLSQNF